MRNPRKPLFLRRKQGVLRFVGRMIFEGLGAVENKRFARGLDVFRKAALRSTKPHEAARNEGLLRVN
jgi:hypothetical protein